MALWNDKRTPPGVVTDSASGQQGRMGAGNGGFQPLPAPAPAPDSTAVRGIKEQAATKAGKRTGAFATPKKVSQKSKEKIADSIGSKLGDPAPRTRMQGRW